MRLNTENPASPFDRRRVLIGGAAVLTLGNSLGLVCHGASVSDQKSTQSSRQVLFSRREILWTVRRTHYIFLVGATVQGSSLPSLHEGSFQIIPCRRIDNEAQH